VPTSPTAIRLNLPGNLLHVTWEDGHESTFDGGYVRFVCPCAGCRGHGPGQVPEPLWSDCKDVRMQHVEAVGAYALKFALSDGHATGIYSYDLLRKSCPSEIEGLDAAGRPREATS
jgi:DUF971 family protein